MTESKLSMTKSKLIISLMWKVSQIGSLITTLTLFFSTCLYPSVYKVRVHVPAPLHSPQKPPKILNVTCDLVFAK